MLRKPRARSAAWGRIPTPFHITWFSRGVAGHVQDKAFGMWLRERNSGESALIGALENSLGTQIVSTLNAETFMLKTNADPDTAKSLVIL
jgi:hypothetical protein